MMRRVGIIAAVAALMLALTAVAAWAASPAVTGCNATSGPDQIFLGPGNDLCDALPGNDMVSGGDGNDELIGAEDSDKVNGNLGNDKVDLVTFDTAGSVDQGQGAGGNDTILAKDGRVDIISCGPGKRDKVFFDVGLDSVTKCEIKNPSSGMAAADALAEKER